MTPAIKPASRNTVRKTRAESKTASSMSTKRKAAPAAFSAGDHMYGEDQADYDSDDNALVSPKGASRQGELGVTKRTLQNRKAQREFRKRREARVKDLEERCRRFDQMGLEASAELQKVARNLKEENELLRGFVTRIGYGNMMPSILDGVGGRRQSTDSSFQPAFAGAFGAGGESEKGESHSHPSPIEGRGQGRARASASRASQNMAAPSLSSGGTWMEGNAAYAGSRDRKSSTSPSSRSNSSSSANGPLLSLNFQQQADAGNKRPEHQRQPDFTTTSNNDSSSSRMLPASISPNGVLNSFLSQMNGQMGGGDNADGSGMAGSAMLGGFTNQSPRGYGGQTNSFSNFPVPQRTHQNGALLNPNPIPFAFNLSNEPPQPTSSWWEQMGGGRFISPGNENNELDEKAQAVAAAQNSNGGAQSPFDLSSFLQGGTTPGGGFSLGNFGNQDDAGLSKSTPSDGNDTDHMRTFIRLLERKVAEREAHTVASLGFQPPSQDPSQRRKEEGEGWKSRDCAGGLSPTGVYSRLAEHPAFLSTDARELEELVDALGSGAARSPKEQDESKDALRSSDKPSQQPSTVYLYRPVEMVNKRSHSQNSASGSGAPLSDSKGAVEVDERAIDRLLGLLDRKRILCSLDQGAKPESLSMAMT